jgi:hypothetical protein
MTGIVKYPNEPIFIIKYDTFEVKLAKFLNTV